MNRLSEQQVGTDTSQAQQEWATRRFQATAATSAVLATVDQRRRALEHRLELAKQRLVTDIGELSTLLSTSAGSMRRGFVRAAVVMGGLLLFAVATIVMRRRRRLRVRFL